MTAKEYLQEAKRKKAVLNNLLKDKESVKEMLYSLGGCSEGERVQASRNTDKFGTLYGRIDEMERQIDDKMAELMEFQLQLSEKINALENEKNIEVLHRRYIRFQSWERIANDMNYSVRYILKIHGLALEEFRRNHGDEFEVDAKSA